MYYYAASRRRTDRDAAQRRIRTGDPTVFGYAYLLCAPSSLSTISYNHKNTRAVSNNKQYLISQYCPRTKTPNI